MIRFLSPLAGTAAFLAALSLAPAPAHAEYPGTMVSGTGLCLNVVGSEVGKKGGQVVAYLCHGGDNQNWTIQGKRGEIRSGTGMCLDASRSNMHKNGAKVMIWKCHGGPNQQWVFAGQGLRNGSGLCLDINRNDLRKSNGRSGKVALWECHFKDNQQWDFREAVSATPQPPSSGRKGGLPHVSQVPPGQPSALDGVWKLAANNIPYKLEAGRIYAMAEYMHLFVFPVAAQDVVVRDVAQTGPGQLSGKDLALGGPWTARLQGDGTLAITVQGMLGPFSSTMIPLQLSNPQWFAQERAALSGGAPPPPRLPVPLPGPAPQPPAPPAGDPDSLYPPGWGD